MQLAYLLLKSPNCDPATGKRGVTGSRDTFTRDEGYEITLTGSVVLVRHSARTVVFAVADMDHGVPYEAPPQPETPAAKKGARR